MLRLASLLVLSVLGASCANKPVGGVMLTMRTDLRVPLGVDVVGVYIQRVEGGRSTTIAASEVYAEYVENGEKRVRLPGTLAVESDGRADVGIRVRVVAYDDARVPVAMREARVTLPTNALKALPMPLLWMNTDDVQDMDPGAGGPVVTSLQPQEIDAFARFRSDFCGDDSTLDDTGACRPIDLDVTTLADFVPARATSADANEAAEATAAGPHGFCPAGVVPGCFDLDGCFPRNETELNFQTLQVDAADVIGLGTPECSVSLGAMSQLEGGIRVRDVALAVEAEEVDGATCVEPGRCYIPLDAASGASLRVDEGRIVLPPGVCRKASKGRIVRIAASPLCARKPAEQELCTDATGALTRGRCKDGSGWNGQGDPLPVEPDAGPDSSDACTALPQATGFWVAESYLTVVTSSGELSTFDTAQAAGECLTGAARSSALTGLGGQQRYRLLGSGNLIALTATTTSGALPTAALLTLPPAGGSSPKVNVVPLPPGAWAGGAFFEADPDPVFAPSPVAVFQSSTELRFGSASGLRASPYAIEPRQGEAAVNLVSYLDSLTPRIDELYVGASGAKSVRSTAFDDGEPVSTSATGFSDYAPRTLARSSSGTMIVLGVDATQTQIAKMVVDDQSSTVDFVEVGRFPGVAPAEATLSFAESDGKTFVYFGVDATITYVQVGVGADGATPVQVALPPATQVHAVQVVGQSVYWLESVDASTTLHRASLQGGELFAP